MERDQTQCCRRACRGGRSGAILGAAYARLKPSLQANAGVFIGHEGVVERQGMVDAAFKEMRFEPERIDQLPHGHVRGASGVGDVAGERGGRSHRGFDGWLRLNDELREVWAEWHVTPERIVAVGDRVVSIETVRGRGRGSGLETKAQYGSIWTFANGRVTRVELGFDPNEALKAVGLAE
jgi:hypothetical protein